MQSPCWAPTYVGAPPLKNRKKRRKKDSSHNFSLMPFHPPTTMPADQAHSGSSVPHASIISLNSTTRNPIHQTSQNPRHFHAPYALNHTSVVQKRPVSILLISAPHICLSYVTRISSHNTRNGLAPLIVSSQGLLSYSPLMAASYIFLLWSSLKDSSHTLL